MDDSYELVFTGAFWRAVDDLGLCRSEITSQSLGMMRNAHVGRSLNGQNGSVRVLDVDIAGKGIFRWYYIVEPDLGLIMNVFIVPNIKPSRNRGDDAITMARLVEIVLRIYSGG
jgi:hypothetical protein